MIQRVEAQYTLGRTANGSLLKVELTYTNGLGGRILRWHSIGDRDPLVEVHLSSIKSWKLIEPWTPAKVARFLLWLSNLADNDRRGVCICYRWKELRCLKKHPVHGCFFWHLPASVGLVAANPLNIQWHDCRPIACSEVYT